MAMVLGENLRPIRSSSSCVGRLPSETRSTLSSDWSRQGLVEDFVIAGQAEDAHLPHGAIRNPLPGCLSFSSCVLVRRVCEQCKAPAEPSTVKLVDAGFDAAEAATLTPRAGRGAIAAGARATRAASGLFEVMEMSEALRELISPTRRSPTCARRRLTKAWCTLRQSGLRKVREGVTTIEEVVRGDGAS